MQKDFDFRKWMAQVEKIAAASGRRFTDGTIIALPENGACKFIIKPKLK